MGTHCSSTFTTLRCHDMNLSACTSCHSMLNSIVLHCIQCVHLYQTGIRPPLLLWKQKCAYVRFYINGETLLASHYIKIHDLFHYLEGYSSLGWTLVLLLRLTKAFSVFLPHYDTLSRFAQELKLRIHKEARDHQSQKKSKINRKDKDDAVEERKMLGVQVSRFIDLCIYCFPNVYFFHLLKWINKYVM